MVFQSRGDGEAVRGTSSPPPATSVGNACIALPCCRCSSLRLGYSLPALPISGVHVGYLLTGASHTLNAQPRRADFVLRIVRAKASPRVPCLSMAAVILVTWNLGTAAARVAFGASMPKGPGVLHSNTDLSTGGDYLSAPTLMLR
jgi:hypothetical protein